MVSLHAMLFVSLVGFGLVFQDLRDEAAVGFGGNKDGGQLEGLHQPWVASCLLAFILLDASQLRSSRGGLGWLRRQVGVTVMAPCGV